MKKLFNDLDEVARRAGFFLSIARLVRIGRTTTPMIEIVCECSGTYKPNPQPYNQELDFLVGAVLFPTKPFAAIVGGADIFSNRRLIEHLLDKVDIMLLGGNLIFSFLIAQGLEVGSCVVQDIEVECAAKIIMMAQSKGVSLLLPSDVVITDDRSAYANSKIVPASAIPADWVGVDIGPDTIKTFGRALKTTKTIVWNGLMGTCEAEKFVDGTKAITRILADLTKKGVKTIIGGSDTIAAVEKFGLVAKMKHISTSGGASLNLLQGEPLISVLGLNVV